MAELDPALGELAAAFDIATEYWDWQGRHVAVPADTIVKVLAALGVDASTPDAAGGRLAAHAHVRGPGCCRPAWPSGSTGPRRSGCT